MGAHYVWVRGRATGNDNTLDVGLNDKIMARVSSEKVNIY